MIHTTNNAMCSLLFQASLPTRYWAKSLYATTYLGDYRHTMRCPDVHARATHGPVAHTRATRGTDVTIRVFVCTTHGLGFTLRPTPPPPYVPAMTSDSCGRTLPRQVVGLPPRHHGS
jgi:hypothetical protein